MGNFSDILALQIGMVQCMVYLDLVTQRTLMVKCVDKFRETIAPQIGMLPSMCSVFEHNRPVNSDGTMHSIG